MQANFWHERWEQNQIGFHEEAFNVHLQTFWETINILPGSKIFVPLCGKILDMLWLLSQGYKVLGVEISPLAVENLFSENILESHVTDCGNFQLLETDDLSIYLGDFFALSSENLAACNAIYDRAALIALSPVMRKLYAEHLRTILPAISHTLLVTLEYTQSEMQGPPFSVHENEVRKLFEEEFNIECLFEEDCLEQNDNFKQRGLTRRVGKVYWLSKYPDLLPKIIDDPLAFSLESILWLRNISNMNMTEPCSRGFSLTMKQETDRGRAY